MYVEIPKGFEICEEFEWD